MKIRSGFVSNSSSSSFVLEVGKPFNHVLDVAKYMIPKRKWDDDSELVLKVEKLIERKRDPKTVYAVCFRSCNYDTYIVKMDRYFIISTCHNHNWDLSQWNVNAPPEYYDYFGDDYFYELPRSVDFLHLNYDVVGRRPERYAYCKECYTDMWSIDSKGERETLCPCCGKPEVKDKL